MGRLYHYTSEQSHARIVASGRIKMSQNFQKDCVYGDGVYLTTLNPEDFDKTELAKNNYGGAWRKRLADGRLDYYVEIEIPYSNLNLQRCEAGGRDVYLYVTDLDLSEFKWQSGKNSEWTYTEIIGAVALGTVAVGLGAFLGKVLYDTFTKPKTDNLKKKELQSDNVAS